MDWAGKSHPVETLAEWGAPVVLAAAAAGSASVTGLPLAAKAAGGVMALSAGIVAMRMAGAASLAREPGFEPVELEPTDEFDVLLLEDRLGEPAAGFAGRAAVCAARADARRTGPADFRLFERTGQAGCRGLRRRSSTKSMPAPRCMPRLPTSALRFASSSFGLLAGRRPPDAIYSAMVSASMKRLIEPSLLSRGGRSRPMSATI